MTTEFISNGERMGRTKQNRQPEQGGEKSDKRIYYDKKDSGYVAHTEVSNQRGLAQIGKMVERGEAKCLNIYLNGHLYYWVSKKIEDGNQ